MDPSRIDQILQFALAVAAHEDDPRQRALGPIHLVKYVYLADLAYAEAHGGETFTEAPWRFHHYGPWAVEVYQRIEAAAEAIGATRQTFPTRYDTDVVRYSVEYDILSERLIERALPWVVASTVRRAVHEHGADTEGLLHYVYATAPMLKAAPGEPLDFAPPTSKAPPASEGPTERAAPGLTSSLSTVPPAAAAAPDLRAGLAWSPRRVERERRRAVAELRERVRARLNERLSQPRALVSPPPRYDEVFFEGTKRLDELAGPRPPEGEAEAVFSDDVWKSPTRGGRDLP